MTTDWCTPQDIEDANTNLHDVCRTLAARLDKLERNPSWSVIGSVEIGRNDIVFIRPTDQALTPNQAREYEDYLAGKLHRQVVVLPFPGEVALTHVSHELAAATIARINKLECEIKSLRTAQTGIRVVDR